MGLILPATVISLAFSPVTTALLIIIELWRDLGLPTCYHFNIGSVSSTKVTKYATPTSMRTGSPDRSPHMAS